MKRIAIFASGKGSNAEAIIQHFKDHPSIQVALIVTNNPEAGVLKIAAANNIVSAIVTTHGLQKEKIMRALMECFEIDFIVLAGFLKMIPEYLLQKFPKKIINIHPALLPLHGGKGMYGMKVHEAVVAGKEAKTGITIHFVNDKYDDGEVILQKEISLKPADNSETIAEQVNRLEHEWYPKTIEKLLS
jgi:phosphoribosylglycinamide formyltransferase-1